MISKLHKAFTLIELMIVIAIIAILSVAFLPSALKAPAKARDAGRMKNVRDIQASVESYAATHQGTNQYVVATGDIDAAEALKMGWKLPDDTSKKYYYGYNGVTAYYIGVPLESTSTATHCVDPAKFISGMLLTDLVAYAGVACTAPAVEMFAVIGPM